MFFGKLLYIRTRFKYGLQLYYSLYIRIAKCNRLVRRFIFGYLLVSFLFP